MDSNDETSQPSRPYKLNCREDFLRYLEEADIKLVRPEFLQKLDAHGRVWPRRQEAELEEGALYTPRAVDNFKVIPVSHCWETMEHPDPCGFQLAQLALAVDGLLYAQDWIEDENAGFFVFFIDYISLYQ